ncbi:MAG: NAD-dependent epimerase/dehydratase family protein [Planctomycetota bacterium]|jgi:nucleoside-diphosphate-sugar epimerase
MTGNKGRLALVTGGHGFLGSHLVDLLLARGFKVRGLLRADRPASVFRGLPVEVARGDLRRSDGLQEAVRGAEYVFHVAGLLSARGPAEFRAVNVEGTRRLAAAVVRAAPGCLRFVYVSSQAAAGPSPDGRPVREEEPPRPLTHYGRSKLAGERVLPATLETVPWSVLRPPAIYGPRDDGILPFFRLAARGWAAGLEGRGRRFNLLHARDVVEGVLAAAAAPVAAGRVYFLSDRHGHTYGAIARSLARAFGRRARRIPVPDLLLDLAAVLTDEYAVLAGTRPLFGRDKARELKARWWLCSAERAARELGWRARIRVDEGFAETARWYIGAGKVRAPGLAAKRPPAGPRPAQT